MKKKSARLRVRKNPKKNNQHWLLGYANKLIPLFLLILFISSIFLARFIFAKNAALSLADPRNQSPTNNETLDTNNFNFSWSPSSSTNPPVSYLFEISDSSDMDRLTGKFKEPLVSTPNTNSLTTATLSNTYLLDGVYYWHVRAIDSEGQMSNWSNVTKFNVSTRPPKPINFAPNNGAYLQFNNCNDFDNLKFSWQDLTSLNIPVAYVLEFSNFPEIYSTEPSPTVPIITSPSPTPIISTCDPVTGLNPDGTNIGCPPVGGGTGTSGGTGTVTSPPPPPPATGNLPSGGQIAVGGFMNPISSLTLSNLENHIVNSPIKMGGVYYWHVKTVYKDGTGNDSEWSDVYRVQITVLPEAQNCFSAPTITP